MQVYIQCCAWHVSHFSWCLTTRRLDRTKIETVGMRAIGEFLQKLNVYKAVGDVQSMTEMYNGYCAVGEEYVKLREEVLAKKKPRRVLVQSHSEVVSNFSLTNVKPHYTLSLKSRMSHGCR